MPFNSITVQLHIYNISESRMGPFFKIQSNPTICSPNPIRSTTVSNFLTHIQSNPYATKQTNVLLENYNEINYVQFRCRLPKSWLTAVNFSRLTAVSM